MKHELDDGDQVAEGLALLLDAVAEAVQARASRGGDDAIAVEQLLMEEGDVRARFIDFAARLRDGAGIDLALVEWVAKAGDPATILIHSGGESTDDWPVWRRIA